MIFLRKGHLLLYFYRNYTFVSMIFFKPYVISYIHIHYNIVIVIIGLYQIFEKNMFLREAIIIHLYLIIVFSLYFVVQ